jgi:hypothetical protein
MLMAQQPVFRGFWLVVMPLSMCEPGRPAAFKDR